MPSDSRSPSRSRSRTRSRSRDRSPYSYRTGSPQRSVSPRRVSRSPSRTPSRSPSPGGRRNGGRSDDHDPLPAPRGRSYTRSPSRRGTPPASRSAKIVVEQLTKNVKVDHLRELFGHFGPIKDIKLPMNSVYNTNRGTAYILYEEIDDAERAIAKMHEAQLDGAKISVSIVLPRRRFSRSPPPIRRPFAPRDRDPYDSHPVGGPPGAYRPPPMSGPSERHRSPYRGRSRSPPRGYGGRGRGRGGYGGDRGYYRRSNSRSRSPVRSRSRSYSSRSPSLSPGRRGGGGGYRRRDSPPRARGGGGGRRRSPSYSSYDSRSRSWSRDRVSRR